MTWLFPCYPVTRQMKQQLFLSYGWGGKSGGKTRLAECPSFCQVLLGPVHNKEMDWQVEKEDREASMIYCLQPRRAFQLLWQSIYQRNQNILHHPHRDVLQIQITSFVFLWLNKSIKSSYVPKQVCVSVQHAHTHTHTHLSHQRSGIYQISHCNYLSMRLKCITSVLWNEQYVISSRLEVCPPYCIL